MAGLQDGHIDVLEAGFKNLFWKIYLRATSVFNTLPIFSIIPNIF